MEIDDLDNEINEQEEQEELVEQEELTDGENIKSVNLVHTGNTFVAKMYEDYFLDYASYVILERAVPAQEDGFKPVQRRILHAMKTMDDGRYHKVANIIGQTMQYHPHGDASIGDALVNMGQKDLLIDCQGNWGDFRTGDGAAAPRYIEARLTKFALEVGFNGDTTHWQLTYDGRKKEPINLPMKFPLLLAQGVEGIAVGLSTKVLPHNFQELLLASIDLLNNKPVALFPDFPTGGIMDATAYNDGMRGGKVRVRAKIEQLDKKTLSITEIPYSTTTGSLIESIIKASNKNKIKIKQVVDNTAEHVDIRIELPPGVSPDVTIDALYAFTDCEAGISPLCCVVDDNKPRFITITELLKLCTEQTKDLLKWELENKIHDLSERLFFASLEKIFIKERIYRDIEECENWDEVIKTIHKGLEPFIKDFLRAVTDDDVTRLTEIKIKRISKYNSFEADELIKRLSDELTKTRYNLEHLVQFTIDWFQHLLDKYGKGRERKTQIMAFDKIEATAVIVNNTKLYVNKADGFIGWDLKKDEFVADCSDMDDIIVFLRDGKYMVSKISAKSFVGKDIIHVGVWRKGDERTTYNCIYANMKEGVTYIKRFHVEAVTRDRPYPIGKEGDTFKVLYFSANPNGEAETIQVQLTPTSTAKQKVFDYDFKELAIKGRSSQGNQLTKYTVRKITQTKAGVSTLGGLKVWYDPNTGRLNTNEYGNLLGEFHEGDAILSVYKDGKYELSGYDSTSQKFDINNVVTVEKWHPDTVISALYYNGDKQGTFVKRFKIETSTKDEKFDFIPDSAHRETKLLYASTKAKPKVEVKVKMNSKNLVAQLVLSEFIEVKGWKALGNKYSNEKVIFSEELIEEPAIKVPEAPVTSHKEIPFEVIDTNQSNQIDMFGPEPKAEDKPRIGYTNLKDNDL